MSPRGGCRARAYGNRGPWRRCRPTAARSGARAWSAVQLLRGRGRLGIRARLQGTAAMCF